MNHLSDARWNELCEWALDDIMANAVADFYQNNTEDAMALVTLTQKQQEFLKRRGFLVIDREPRDYTTGPQETKDTPYIYVLPSINNPFKTTMCAYIKQNKKSLEVEPDWHFGMKDPNIMGEELSISMLEQLVALCAPVIDNYFKEDLNKPIKIYVHDAYKPWMDIVAALTEKYSRK
ncbi:MAG: hypothetical protein WC916_04100 [Candidatus Woesearchaeota archaeon]